MMSRLDHLRRLLLNGVSHRSLVWAELNRAAGEAPQATVEAPARRGPAAQLRNLGCFEDSARRGSNAHSTGLSAH
jgi:hypothetical protein